jgi:small subunit ribosomal protein S20
MANTDSARKRIRQTEKRTARNKARKSRVRTFVRKLEEAIASGDKAVAQEAFRAAQPRDAARRDEGHPARQHGCP